MTSPTAPFRLSAYQIMLTINVLLFIVSLGLAALNNNWLAAFAVGLPAACY